MNTWQRFWQRRSRKARRRVRRRIAASRFRRLVSEQLEPRVVLAAPVAVGDSYSVIDNCNPLAILPGTSVLANDSDADGDPMVAVRVDGPVHGTLTLNAGGIFQYTPSVNFEGLDSFTYRASDGASSSGVATVTLNVTSPLGDLPVNVVGDVVTATEDVPRTVTAPGMLANDSSSCGRPLTAQLVIPPPYGSLAMGSDGSFTYVPSLNINGAVSFTYRASDGVNLSNVATVVLNIQPVPDAPVAAGDSYTTSEDVGLTVGARGILNNDSDSDADPLAVKLDSVVAFPIGAFSLGADGSFTYTPKANFNGLTGFYYRAVDSTGQQSNLVTVTINVTPVNDPPVANNDWITIFPCDHSPVITSAPGFLGNDTDPEGDTLTAMLVTPPSRGWVALNPDGSYTEDAYDTFTYRASDGQFTSNVATINLSFAPAACNVLPAGNDDSFVVAANQPFVVPAPGALSNDKNAPRAVLSFGPNHGSVLLNSNGSFTYTPSAGYVGLDHFSYLAGDQYSSDSANVLIQVTPDGDHPPTAVTDRYTFTKNRAVYVKPGVLTNDFDPDIGTLSAGTVATTSHGSLYLYPDGSFYYGPATDFTGNDSFTYVVGDGQRGSNTVTVTLNVTEAGNHPPTAVNDGAAEGFTTVKNSSLTIAAAAGVLANDIDADGDTLTAKLVSGPQHGALTLSPGGGLNYSPALFFSGTDSFTYRAADNQATSSNTATVVITVTDNGQHILARDDSYAATQDLPRTIGSGGVLSNDLSDTSEAISAELDADAAHGHVMLGIDGSFTFTPTAGYFGIDSFTYHAKGLTSGVSNVATVTISVAPPPRPPVAYGDSYASTEDVPLTVAAAQGVLANDTDEDGPGLTAVLASQPANGSVFLGANGTLTYLPSHNFSGSDSFRYRAVDPTGLASNTATVTINVTPINDAPVAINDAYNIFGLCGTPLAVSPASGVLPNDLDVDGDTLTATLVGNPLHGSLTFAADGSFTYSPSAFFMGVDSFTYRASDGQVATNVATVTVNVTGPPLPVAVNDSYTATEDIPRTISATAGVLANDADPDCPVALGAALNSQPLKGTVSLGSNGSFTYFPLANFNGTDSFTYRSFDGIAFSNNVGTVTINILQVNDPPAANNDVYAATEHIPLVVALFGVLENDSDVDNDPALNHPLQPGHLFATLVSGPNRGAIDLDPFGGFTYVPSLNFNGADSFTYRAIDQPGASSGLATVTINIASFNDPPTFTKGPDQNVTDESGPQVVPGWAKNISPGPADEVGQMVGFSVVGNTNPGIIEGDIMIDPAGKLSFTPQPNVEGTATVTVRLQDSGGTASGGIDFSEQQFQITVDKRHRWHNEMPPLSPHDRGGLEVVFEDEAHSITPTDVLLVINYLNSGLPTAIDATMPLANGTTRPFYDVDGDDSVTPTDALLIIDVLNAGLGGPLDLVPGGEGAALAAGEGTNQPPVEVGDAFPATEDVPLTVTAAGVLINDSDPDFDPIAATLAQPPGHGQVTLSSNGGFTYSPTANFNGSDSFTYRAFDGLTMSNLATVTLNVLSVNDAPSFNLSQTSITKLDTVSSQLFAGLATGMQPGGGPDEAKQTLTLALIGNTNPGLFSSPPIIDASGTLSYKVAPNVEGMAIITVELRDSGGTAAGGMDVATRTFSITIQHPHRWHNSMPPYQGQVTGGMEVLFEDAAHSITPTDAMLIVNYLFSSLPKIVAPIAPMADGITQPFYDVDGDDVVTPTDALLIINSLNAGLGGPLETITGANGPVAFADFYDYSRYGTYPICDSVLRIDFANGVLRNDVGVAGQPLSAVLVAPPQFGSLTLAPSGEFTYSPYQDFGVDSFVYRATGGAATSSDAVVTIFKHGSYPNTFDAGDSYPATEDIPLTVAPPGVLANDLNMGLVPNLSQSPAHGTVMLSPSGGFTYIPNRDFNGADIFRYRRTDGSYTTCTDSAVTINVQPVNDAPTFTTGPDQHVTDESGPRVVPAWAKNISPGPPDEAGQTTTLSVAGNTNPGLFAGNVAIDQAGNLSFTPQPNVEGTAVVTVRLQDSGSTENGGIDFSQQKLDIIVKKSHRWHNAMPPAGPGGRGGMDVDGNLNIDSTDALLIINYLNSNLPSHIPWTVPIADGITRPFYDVDGDDSVTPTDALLIIDVLNAGQGGPVDLKPGGEGEAAAPPPGIQPSLADLIALMAYDAAEQATRRRAGR